MPSMPPCHLREATDRDAPAVFALLSALGLRLPGTDAGRTALWRRLWIDNPALAGTGDPPPGWVLEADGAVVGFFGSIPRAGVLAGRRLRIAVASLWGVQPAYRAHVPGLAATYFAQPGADVCLVTTAVPATARIFLRHGGHAVPQPGLDSPLSWVIDPQGFVTAALRRKGVGGGFATLAGRVARKTRRFSRTPLHRQFDRPRDVAVLGAGDVGGEFDGLWRRVGERTDRLMAVRDSAALRWHFAGRDDAVVFALRGTGGLEGYAVVVRDDAPAAGLRRLRIADLVLADDDAAKTTALLAAAFAHGDAECCHVVELAGLAGEPRRQAQALRPLARKLPAWPAYYRAADPDVAAALSGAAAWALSGFDGDTTLI